jgi:hypothetical protein
MEDNMAGGDIAVGKKARVFENDVEEHLCQMAMCRFARGERLEPDCRLMLLYCQFNVLRCRDM